MGRITAINSGTTEIPAAHRRRFSRYFPGLFAYVRAMSDDYSTSVEKVVSAFETALREPNTDDDAFVLSLFANARELCGVRNAAHDSGEREVLSLTFDALLTREQVSVLMEMPVDAVISTLMRGLRRLQSPRVAVEAAGDTALHGFAA